MRADDLVILLEIARCGSMVGAASALGLNHTTVSRRVSALEADLHAPVLVRRVQGCELTELGSRLLTSCEQVERALSDARDVAGSRPRERDLAGLVRVATTPSFGTHFVAPLMADLKRLSPELTVEIVSRTRLAAHGVGADIEIGVGEPVAARPGAEKLTDYRLGLYASEGFASEFGLPRTFEELQDYPLIFYVESLLRVGDLDRLAKSLGTHKVAFASTNVEDQRIATVVGAGIGLLPSFVGEVESSLVRVLPDLVAPTLDIWAALAPRQLRRPAASAVLQAIRESVRDRHAELMPVSW
ncbi:LysR family transcriptional regulator [Tsukamurella asaccharolytica]|uniref:LysR family transcriptional regulator n=1 Tax=Tsukamurella asaccharolytica TaxID=2592067 RepID=A0A5C5REK5_9ACTN|nr:LysR family transcriptional regulator [Tsukamurella asaccharolytica]TWS21366.1 LysR family transcriptional regulator [Tsukamurella asaccharolytica]